MSAYTASRKASASNACWAASSSSHFSSSYACLLAQVTRVPQHDTCQRVCYDQRRDASTIKRQQQLLFPSKGFHTGCNALVLAAVAKRTSLLEIAYTCLLTQGPGPKHQ
ncbi:hypothetical protein WJX79_009283 [Trebouxia sp. C0005]